MLRRPIPVAENSVSHWTAQVVATSTAYKEGSDICKLVRGSVEASSALCQETCAHIYPVRITGSQARQLSHMHVQDLTL